MWSSCFHPGSLTESTHSLGSTGSLPAPDTPMLSARSLLSAHSSKSLQQLRPEPPVDHDTGSGSESGSADDMVGSGIDAVMSESPRADSSKQLFGSEHGEPDCQLLGHGWKLWAHKHVLKSENNLAHTTLLQLWVFQCRVLLQQLYLGLVGRGRRFVNTSLTHARLRCACRPCCALPCAH